MVFAYNYGSCKNFTDVNQHCNCTLLFLKLVIQTIDIYRKRPLIITLPSEW